MNTSLVVAIVLNWNLPGDTVRCVRSLLREQSASLQVVIVDNGSGDDSLDWFARELSDVPVVVSPQNRYYAGGNNLGLAAALDAGADWVLVINNDTVAAPDMVSHLVRAAEAQAASLVAPLIYRLDAPEACWDAGQQWPRWRPLAARARAQTDPYPVDMVTGCAMLIRADMARALGGFDERYVMYYEDADLCLRLRQLGGRIVVAPEARLWHAVGSSAALASERSAEQKARFRLRFYRQHAPWPWRPVTLLMVTGHTVVQVLLAWLRRQPGRARALWRGLCLGWREPIEGRL
ncbi:MAG: glycosyltransferase family 2 protein [Chloroflexi bacterium]|jgi:GT2 family glycosyltransferase|nr:glycosyltransferase family 2 protein [Chloroflexota bacterium]